MMALGSPVSVPLAFGAGLLTVAAPCILPMMPLLLGASVQQGSKWRPVFIVAGFVSVFAASALLFGALTSTWGEAQEYVRNGAIVMLGIFGALMVWKKPFEMLSMRMSGLLNRISRVGDGAGPGNWGGLLLGASMGAVWTPCAGPVLGSILALVATANDLTGSGLLLTSYSAGAALPMLLIAYGGQLAVTQVRLLSRYTHVLQKVSGVLVVLTAVAMYLQYDALAAVWLTSLFEGA